MAAGSVRSTRTPNRFVLTVAFHVCEPTSWGCANLGNDGRRQTAVVAHQGSHVRGQLTVLKCDRLHERPQLHLPGDDDGQPRRHGLQHRHAEVFLVGRQCKGPRLSEYPLLLVARHDPEKRHRVAETVRRHRLVELLHVCLLPVSRHPGLRVGTVRDELHRGMAQDLLTPSRGSCSKNCCVNGVLTGKWCLLDQGCASPPTPLNLRIRDR
jgi:hypothetical protein